MCYRTECATCGKPTWAGCGKHIETALAGVPEEERCHCREDKATIKPVSQATEDILTDITLSKTASTTLDNPRSNADGKNDKISLVQTLAGHTDRVWDIALHATLPLIATASADKTVRLYSAKNYKHVGTIEGNHKRSIRSCAWKTGEPKPVLATGSFDGTAGIWDCQEDEETLEAEWECAGLLEGHENEVKCVAWSASGTLLATCSRDKSIWIWECENYEDPECVSVMQEHSGDVKCVKWHPSEELLASGSYDDEIRIWRDDGDDWICCAVLKGHGGTVWALDFKTVEANTEQRIQLVSASGDSTIRIWTQISDPAAARKDKDALPSIIRPSNNQEWRESTILPKSHQGDIYTVAWSPNTNRIASAGEDGNITIYSRKSVETQSDEQEEWVIACEKISAHGVYEINHLVWGPMQDDQSELLFSAGDDGETRIWRVQCPI